MNSFFKKIATGTVALALTTTVFASSTLAAETSTSTTVSGTESVEISNVSSSFQSITLNGTTQTVPGSLNFDVTDATGSGEGWDIYVSADTFKDATDTTNVKTLSNGLLAMTAPSISAVDGSNSDDASAITPTGGIIDNGAAIKVLSAPTDGGKGSYNVSAADKLSLTLKPSEVYEGTYSSTITVTLTAGV